MSEFNRRNTMKKDNGIQLTVTPVANGWILQTLSGADTPTAERWVFNDLKCMFVHITAVYEADPAMNRVKT